MDDKWMALRWHRQRRRNCFRVRAMAATSLTRDCTQYLLANVKYFLRAIFLKQNDEFSWLLINGTLILRGNAWLRKGASRSELRLSRGWRTKKKKKQCKQHPDKSFLSSHYHQMISLKASPTNHFYLADIAIIVKWSLCKHLRQIISI